MTRKYNTTSNKQRYQFIKLIDGQDYSIKEAADMVGINYENAKVIQRIYRSQGRVAKRSKVINKIRHIGV